MVKADGRKNLTISKGAALVIADPSSLEDWDDDELMAGRRKDVRGRFTGRPPAVVPRAVHQELFRRSDGIMKKALLPATLAMLDHVMGNMLDDPRMEALRQSAARYVIDRAFGKAPERVELDVTSSSLDPAAAPPPWAAQMLRRLMSEQQGDVIDVNPNSTLDAEPDDDEPTYWEDA